MNDKDDKKRGEPTPASNSQELFEEIFKEATMEIRIEKSGKAQSQEYTPVLAPGRWQQQQKLKDAGKRILKPSGPATPKSEKAKVSLPGNAVRPHPAPKPTGEVDKSTPLPRSMPNTDKRKVRRSVVPKAAVLVLLLAMLAVIILNYLGIVDIPLLQDFFNFGHEQIVAQAPVPGKQAAIPPEKVIGSPKQPQEREQNPAKTKDEPKAPPPAPTQASSSGEVKEDKIAELETPTAVAQATSGMEQAKEKAPSVATIDRPNVPEIAATQEPQPVPIQTQPSAKPAAPEVGPPQPRTPQYPYSVYLGSFKTSGAVNKALIEYQEKGLSAYWTRVDLGDKGVWFRFFTGYFQTKEEAQKFIKDRNIQGASPGITRYANLIGIYSSDKEVEDNRRALVSAGFYPYVIEGPDGKSFLYSGAFDRKEYAVKERTLLASKGIKSETTER
jgi:cell division septation protein DedD